MAFARFQMVVIVKLCSFENLPKHTKEKHCAAGADGLKVHVVEKYRFNVFVAEE
jgi:hypothetical protein